MEEKIIKFITEEYISDPEVHIDVNTKLISTGLMDSFSLVSLQRFIETEFKKKIPAPLITAETFNTVGQMVEVITRF
jgi:acyl carrier protein